MKKKVFIVVGSVIIMLVIANTYAYINNSKIQTHINNLDLSRKKVVILSEFRSGIVKASQDKKLYILTGSDSYQSNFDSTISSLNKEINDSYDKGYITINEKSKLLTSLENFDSFSSTYKPSDNLIQINSNTENQMLSYNANQLKILQQITQDISSQGQISKKNNDKVASFSANQTTLIQGISSYITILGSAIALFLKKKLNKEDIDLEDIIEYLTSKNENHPSSDNVHTLKNNINQNEVLLSNAKLLYKQSIKFQDQCEKSNILLKDIDIYMEKLKSTLELIDDYPTSAQKIILQDIEKQLMEFKILFKSLPNYNDFIIDISQSLIDNKNKD
ncbi:MAG: CHASE3 domain-containing protein [Peptostreptococcaceae bacterium]